MKLSEVANAVVLGPVAVGIVAAVLAYHWWQHGERNPFNCDQCDAERGRKQPAPVPPQDSSNP